LYALKSPERRIYDPDEQFFDPILEPDESDWLAGPGATEGKETFKDFAKKKSIRKMVVHKKKIYLVLLGDFKQKISPDVDILLEYSNCFFFYGNRSC